MATNTNGGSGKEMGRERLIRKKVKTTQLRRSKMRKQIGQHCSIAGSFWEKQRWMLRMDHRIFRHYCR